MLSAQQYASGFNPTVASADRSAWVSAGHFGLDQGIVVMMIENHRTELIWRLMRDCPYVRDGPAARRIPRRLAVAARYIHGSRRCSSTTSSHALAQDPHERERLENVHPSGWRNPQPADRYHLVVVGAGPAGLVAAHAAAALGARVALIERDLLGGDCLNFGCVPSKTLSALRACMPRCAMPSTTARSSRPISGSIFRP